MMWKAAVAAFIVVENVEQSQEQQDGDEDWKGGRESNKELRSARQNSRLRTLESSSRSRVCALNWLNVKLEYANANAVDTLRDAAQRGVAVYWAVLKCDLC